MSLPISSNETPTYKYSFWPVHKLRDPIFSMLEDQEIFFKPSRKCFKFRCKQHLQQPILEDHPT